MKIGKILGFTFLSAGFALVLGCSGGGKGNDESANTIIAVGKVTGFVTNDAIGSVIDAVNITIGSKSTSTNIDGLYRIDALEVGKQKFSATKSGYETFESIVTINKDSSIQFDLSMIPLSTGVVLDDFDDGILSSAWQVEMQNATNWTYVESGTNIDVSDITPTLINPGSGGLYAKIKLSQNFSPLNDFNTKFNISWDSAGSKLAMQSVSIRLYDATNTLVTAVGYQDSWVSRSGEKYAVIGSSTVNSGLDSMPLSGTAFIGITRAGNAIEVLWNNESFLSALDSNPISKVELEFTYYAYSLAGVNSFFANESIDIIEIQ